MNIKDLGQIDINSLKNIDIEQIKDFIRTRPDIFIISLLAIITISASIFIFSGQKNKAGQYSKDIQVLKEKLEAAELNKNVEKEYREFVDSFPEATTVDNMIYKISEFAQNRDINIETSSPAKNKSNTLWEQFSIELSVTSTDYKNLVLFLKDIEDAPYAIRIESWLGKMARSPIGRRSQSLSDNTIKSKIRIGAIKLKNE